MTASGPALTLGLSTVGDRIAGILLPEPTPALDTLILWQSPGTPPDALATRPDVTILPLDSSGVAASRNAAIDHAAGDLLLFWDDDMIPNLPGILALRDDFVSRPDLAIAIGVQEGRGRPAPDPRPRTLTRHNSGRVGTPQMMVRLEPVRAAGLRFDRDFGLGGRYPLGDEYVFLADALDAGLKGLHLPHVTGTHPTVSTGDNWSDPKLLTARAAVLSRVWGWRAPLAAAVFLWRHRSRIPLRRFPGFLARSLRAP